MCISSLTTKSQQEAAPNHEQFKAATRRSSQVRKWEDKNADLFAFPLHLEALPMHPDALEMPNANPKPLDLAAVTHDSDKCNVNQGDKENKSMSAASLAAPIPSDSIKGSLDSTAEGKKHDNMLPMTSMFEGCCSQQTTPQARFLEQRRHQSSC